MKCLRQYCKIGMQSQNIVIGAAAASLVSIGALAYLESARIDNQFQLRKSAENAVNEEYAFRFSSSPKLL